MQSFFWQRLLCTSMNYVMFTNKKIVMRGVGFTVVRAPEDPTSRYILDMYRVSKCMSYLTDCHFPSAVGNTNDISNGLKLYFI